MDLMKLCSENIQIFTGDDKTSMSDIIDGFSGNISVTANVAPLEMHMMCKYAIEGNKEKAEGINSKIEIQILIELLLIMGIASTWVFYTSMLMKINKKL